MKTSTQKVEQVNMEAFSKQKVEQKVEASCSSLKDLLETFSKHKVDLFSEEEEEVEQEEGLLVFNVEEAAEGNEWTKYRRFINNVRRRYISLEPVTNRVDDILLRTHSHKLKLKLHLDYFTVIGYQMDHPHCQWLEFGYNHTWTPYPLGRSIPGSSMLELCRDYPNLVNAIDNRLTIDAIGLGQKQLTFAVNLLATSMNRRERAWSLLIVLLMVCEAIRFDFMLERITALCLHNFPLLPFMTSLPQRYHDLPIQQLLSTVRANKRRLLNPLSNKVKVVPDLIPYSLPPASSSIEDLVEVFFVRVNNINGKSSGDFYGKISAATFGHSTQLIYNRGREDSEFIHSGDTLLLTGPSVCIPASPFVFFKFVVLGKRIPFSVSQIDCQDVSCPGVYNKPLYAEFADDYCSLMLGYIVIRDAIQATVEITIVKINGRGNDSAYVYGEISALNDDFSDDYECVLFQKTYKEHVDVCSGELLKLSRSIVAVPWESSLIVKVQLYDDEFSIAQGIAEFPAQLSQSSNMIIYGTGCEVLVRVTRP